MPATIKTIILDFDGVIVESEGVKAQAYFELFNDYPELLDEIRGYYHANLTVPRNIKLRHIVSDIINEEYDKKRAQKLNARLSDAIVQGIIACDYVPGALEFLHDFSSRVHLYIASGTPKEELNIIIKTRGIERYFKEVYGFPCSKHEIFSKILTREKIKPEAAVYIGDQKEDYEIARKTGVHFVGRLFDENLNDPEAPAFRDMAGIGDYFRRILKTGI